MDQTRAARARSARREAGALFGHCSSCGFSSSFASLGRFYEFERSPLCARLHKRTPRALSPPSRPALYGKAVARARRAFMQGKRDRDPYPLPCKMLEGRRRRPRALY